MNSSMTAVAPDQEKLPIYNVNNSYLVNEKIDIDQWKIREGEDSFTFMLIVITQFMAQLAIEMRKIHMENSAIFNQKRINEYTEAVNRVKKGIEEGTSVEKTVSAVDVLGSVAIGIVQLASLGSRFGAEGAMALGHFRDSAVSGTTKYFAADPRQQAEIDKELGNKEKALNDPWSQLEQTGKEGAKDASRLYAEAALIMGRFIQQLQKVLGLERH